MAVALNLEMRGYDIVAEYLIAVGSARDGDLLYRGHAEKSWQPVPFAFRRGQSGIIDHDGLQFWKMMASRFVRPTDDMHALVLAQHYGIPTPLLDWTSNPLTALFFACQHLEDGGHGQVLQACGSQFLFLDCTSAVHPFGDAGERPILFDSSAMNVRSIAQDSYVTLHDREDESVIETSVVFELTPKQKVLTLKALRELGFSPERVYADLNVAAEETRRSLSLMSLHRALSEHSLEN